MPSEHKATVSGPPRVGTNEKREDIQGLRAVAVLVVVAFHAGLPIPGGFVGVDVFFVISGFVIAAMLWRELQRSGRIRLGRFYLRRFKRLTPALALTIAVSTLLSAALLSPLGTQQTVGLAAVGAITMTANLVIAATTGGYFGTRAELNPLLHTWSLSVEEQFYLVFPAILIAGWTLSRKRATPLIPFFLIGTVAILSFALAVGGPLDMHISTLGVRAIREASGFYSPLTRAWEFASGAMLALVLSHWKPMSTRLMPLCSVLGLLLILASAFLINKETPFPGVSTLAPVVGTLLLLFSGMDRRSVVSRFLRINPMIRIGDWSYSIYLWHWPFVVFAGIVWGRSVLVLTVAAVLSVIPAVMSFFWLEQPLRNASHLPRPRWNRLFAATLVPPLFLGSGLWLCAEHGWWSAPVRKMQASVLPRHASDIRECGQREPLSPSLSLRCSWNVGASGKPIYVLGDSQAAAFSEGIIGAGKDLDRPVIIATAYSCPFVDVYSGYGKPHVGSRACSKFVQNSLEYLASASKGTVIVANSDHYWFEKSFKAGEAASESFNDPDSKIGTFRGGLLRTVEALRRAGHEVLLVQPVHQWRHWQPGQCSIRVIVHGRCVEQVPLDEAFARTAAARTAQIGVAQATKSGIFNSAIPLCPAGICSTEAPNFTRYRDANHVSVPQSIDLAEHFRTAVVALQS